MKVVGAHPSTSGMIDIDVCSLERRVSALEQEHREAASSRTCITLSELQAQVNAIKQKLETIEHLSWLGEFTTIFIKLLTSKLHIHFL